MKFIKIDEMIAGHPKDSTNVKTSQEMQSNSRKAASAHSNKIKSKLMCATWLCSLTVPLLIFNKYLTHKAASYCLMLFAGWFVWTFTEYWLHRFSMHDPAKYKKPDGMHAHHHQHPTEIKVTATQRVLFFLIVLILQLAAWKMNNYFTILAGYITGMLGYFLVHWVLHQSWAHKLIPGLIGFHIHHHCKHPDKCFGISVTWWDHLFGTVPKENKVISQKVIDFYFKHNHKHK
jgi:sterol desaturase/sphingolipid hydroxylase (fatty acid hydroxylase superfamily)